MAQQTYTQKSLEHQRQELILGHMGEFLPFMRSRLDSRYQGPAMDPLSRDADYDPFTESIESAILAAMNTYAHETLHYGRDLTYKQSAREPEEGAVEGDRAAGPYWTCGRRR